MFMLRAEIIYHSNMRKTRVGRSSGVSVGEQHENPRVLWRFDRSPQYWHGRHHHHVCSDGLLWIRQVRRFGKRQRDAQLAAR